jgi:hypothetical protein
VKVEIEGQPHEKRRWGCLKNDNSPGDFTKAPRCGARNRRGTPCQAPAMKNGRCRLHGGKSTGPLMREGLERMLQSKLKHGKFTKEMKSVTQYLKTFKATLARLKKDVSRR